MDALTEYLIPISGLKIGLHSFDFQINSDFFTHFPDSLIKEGAFEVHLDFDKRIDLYELVFTFSGSTKTPCDRCLAEINFPVKGENKLIIKFADAVLEDIDVLYIPMKTEELNVAKYIYEYISLALPFIKTFDCQEETDKPCDEEMLALIQAKENNTNQEAGSNPVWDQLKNIKFN